MRNESCADTFKPRNTRLPRHHPRYKLAAEAVPHAADLRNAQLLLHVLDGAGENVVGFAVRVSGFPDLDVFDFVPGVAEEDVGHDDAVAGVGVGVRESGGQGG